MSAYHFKYFQNIQFKNHGIAPTPTDLPTLKAYPTPGVGGRFGIFSLKLRERMNLKVPGAILPPGCAILSTRAKIVRGVGTTPLRRTRVNTDDCSYYKCFLETFCNGKLPNCLCRLSSVNYFRTKRKEWGFNIPYHSLNRKPVHL